jgi:hypothetical protein
MEILRDTLLIAAVNNITLHAVRVTTKKNALADALSPFDWRAVAGFTPS